MVAFNEIPNLRVPFVAVEFDASKASQGPALLKYSLLLIGQKFAAGTGVADSINKVTSPEDVLTLAGRGSQLHRMAIARFASDRITDTYIGILDDNGAGVAATGDLTVTGPATEDGTLALYIGGKLISVAVTDGDADTVVAAAIEAAIDADLDLPVTASVAAAVVTVTHRHKGLEGNALDIRLNYNDGDKTPAGVAVAIVGTGMAGGTTSPVLTTLIANMGDQWFNIWGHPYTDAVSLTAIENELASRFGPLRTIDGVAITSASDSHANLTTLGNGRNSQHSEIMAQPGFKPVTPPSEFAAETAALIAQFGAIDPARPFQTLAYTHALPPAEIDLFTLEERDLLLFDGIATSKSVVSKVQIDRAITTYQTSPSSAPDDAYLDVTTLLTLMFLRFSFRNQMQTRYPRHKLANDGTRFGPGQLVITPKIGKAEAVGWFREMELLGLVEGFDQFKADLIVERSGTDVNRLEFLLPPDLINQLIVTAAQIQFRR